MNKLINKCVNKGYVIPETLIKLDETEYYLLLSDIRKWLYEKHSIYLLTCPKINMKADRQNNNAIMCTMSGWLLNIVFIDTYQEYKSLNEFGKVVYNSELKALEMGILKCLDYID